jgi:hypothetical protein
MVSTLIQCTYGKRGSLQNQLLGADSPLQIRPSLRRLAVAFSLLAVYIALGVSVYMGSAHPFCMAESWLSWGSSELKIAVAALFVLFVLIGGVVHHWYLYSHRMCCYDELAVLTAIGDVPDHSISRGSGGLDDVSKERAASDMDRCWELLKQFSLLIVRGARGSRVGSIHRLQQSAMRGYVTSPSDPTQNARVLIGPRCYRLQDAEALVALKSLEAGVEVLGKLWRFNQEDPSSWPACGDLIEHIRIVAEHAKDALQEVSIEDCGI